MDQRPPPRSDFFRTQERPLIQNPNHHVPPQQQQSQPPPPPSIFHPSSSQQPPAQIPFADPFRRAPDPFLPNPQAQRREGYGLSIGRDAVSGAQADRPPLAGAWSGSSGTNAATSNGNNNTIHHHHHQHSHSQSGPPPPQALSSAMSGIAAASYALDQTRRRSLGAQSPSSRYYTGPQGDPPPPPGPFSNRQMPPPSPSQQPPQGTPYPSQRGPPPPPFSSGRELPGLGPSRPGTGMSISSLLGTDAPSSQPPPSSHHSPTAANAQSPSQPSMQPPSPRKGQSLASKLDYGQWSHQQTPDRHGIPPTSRPAENTPYSTSSSSALFSGARQSPDFARNGPPPLQHLYQTTTLQNPRPYQSSPTDTRNPEQHRQVDERMPSRPNSQPNGFALPHQEAGPREYASPVDSRPPFHQFQQREEPRQQSNPTSSYDDRNALAAVSRDRPITAEPLGHSAYSPPNDPRGAPARENVREEMGRDNVLRRDGHNGPFRTGFRNQYYMPLGATGEAPRSHPQANDPFRRPNDGPNPIFGPEFRPQPHHAQDPNNQDRRTSDPQAHGEGVQYRGQFGEQMSGLMQRSRSSLGIGPEGKRGRASPLPQAVQGAQPPPVGIGSDPSIKSEFGRIFQGLGGGLGGYGNSTPSRQSPMPRSAPDGEPIVLSDNDGTKMTKMGSKSGRKARRVKEEESRLDSESNDGRGTPLGSGGRGNKRAKVGHHHHLHQHNHAHHHHVHSHVHRPEDAFSPAPHPTSTPTGAHHHHHIHSSHHHHHGPRAVPPTPPHVPSRKPNVIVHSQIVIDSVKELPRKHLGSELYNPVIEMPPFATSSHTDDKFGYFARYKPTRVFGEKDLNCTFTIRVPREYLTPASREKVCMDRNLHGTGIYTDDSDPVAMLIHLGWIRGEWGQDIDTSLMDLPPAPPEDQELDEEMLEKPPIPVIPPEDMDLHITLLILPRTKEYKGAVCFGVKSRDWGNDHDGLSWSLVKMRWVDEGNSRAVERTGKGRRLRLEAAESLLEMKVFGKVLSAEKGRSNRPPGMERGLGVQVAA